MVVHPCNPTLRGQKQEDQELKVIVRYTDSLRPAWAKWDPISKRMWREWKKERKGRKGGREKRQTCEINSYFAIFLEQILTFLGILKPLASSVCHVGPYYGLPWFYNSIRLFILAAIPFPCSRGLFSHFCQGSAQSQLTKESPPPVLKKPFHLKECLHHIMFSFLAWFTGSKALQFHA